MEDCKDAPYSEEYYDLLVSYLSLENEYLPEGCIQNIDKDFNVVYLQSAGLPKLDIDQYTYSAIPKCFTILDEEALQAGGIIRVQSQPNLALRGQGVLIGFVDTGIDYQNEVFRNSDGSSRILRIWDQSIRSEDTPEGFLYGTEYTKEQIDMALLTDAPLRVVPHRDEEGHGTFMAGLAAGSEKLSEKFAGVAPYAQIAMVKLKPAKKYLRRFYYIPEGAKAYQENDIMAGVAYLTRLAERYRRPLVIYLGLGSNSGDHSGNSVISYYLNYVSFKRNTAVVVAAGNEATARHHYYGEVAFGQQSDVVEVDVEDAVAVSILKCGQRLRSFIRCGLYRQRESGRQVSGCSRMAERYTVLYLKIHRLSLITTLLALPQEISLFISGLTGPPEASGRLR